MTVENCLDASSRQYTREEYFSMEIEILRSLSWDLNVTTPSDYVELIFSCFGISGTN
jgi:hypothetical protein